MNSFTGALFDALRKFGNNDAPKKKDFQNAVLTLMAEIDPNFNDRFITHCPRFVEKLKEWTTMPNQVDGEGSCHVIAFRGKKHSGKSYLANEVRRLVSPHIPVHEVSFADGIKEIGIMIFESYYPGIREHVYGDRKEVPLCKKGRPMRHFMQTFGTDICRQYLGDDLWVNVWRHRVKQLDGLVLTPDLRFRNELVALQEADADIIHVVQKGLISSDTHVSETQLDKSEHCEFVFLNDKWEDRDATRHRLAKMLIEPLNFQ